MGISEFGEMHRLAEMAYPDICVITNIGLCHLENLLTRDGILKAKTESFEHLTPEGTAVLNGDDDKLSAPICITAFVPSNPTGSTSVAYTSFSARYFSPCSVFASFASFPIP